jgi:potassium/hydrogen antiporter
LPAKEVAYVGWIGLRGAVPIVLATFPILAQVPGAMTVFNLVFFIVVASTLVPGTTIRAVTRWLGLMVPERPQPSAVLEVNSTCVLNGELVSFLIDPSVAVCGAQLRDIEFPPGAAVVMIVRGQDLIAPRGQTKIDSHDHVYVFFKPQDRPTIELLFGSPELG